MATRADLDHVRELMPSRFVSVGVPRRFITSYGTADEHDRQLGMDVAGIRRRLVAALELG